MLLALTFTLGGLVVLAISWLQRQVQEASPFSIMFQRSEQVAMLKNIEGFVSGSNFDLVFYRNVTK